MSFNFAFNKTFSTNVDRSDRVLEVAEAFGLGLDDKEFVVLKDLEIQIERGDVIYVTGQSGAGKSIILRQLSEKFADAGEKVADLDGFDLKDVPLIDQIGKDLNEALFYLSCAGLNEAYLFIRKPKELSDGQRYRFKLAKLMESKASVWVADEFMAILDRETAKCIAYTVRKMAKKMGATLAVATTHKDMLDDLRPNLYIEKRFREKIKVERPSFDSEDK